MSAKKTTSRRRAKAPEPPATPPPPPWVAPQTTEYEKLGAFYVGRPYDPDHRAPLPGAVLYDSKDLVTHAVCVGMTGSGKTGLCIGFIEEAAIDGIPVLAIDPKGDLANLMLTFPDLRPDDFRPWIDEHEAARKGLTPDAFAAQQAETWRNGLASWGQDGERIRRLRQAAEIAVYTPGSRSGIPVSILSSFAVPPQAVRDDPELFRERVTTTVSGLLGLIGVDADPVQDREHILLATLVMNAWSTGQDLDVGTLVTQVQQPPIAKVGVLDIDSFYPEKERMKLALALNNIIASPSFSAWMEGVPLDLDQIMRTPDGRPRVAIMSIAHLSEAERMFFVALLLDEVLGWIRGQSGTASLRAILYMDEIFGYFPPVAMPPSKRPLLTLLKQARAYGLGVMLATQNPVDLDYKGLANTGTWLLGRLQTERDKARVMDGLEGAAAAQSTTFDRESMDTLLSGLGSRVFLMNNVHEDGPVVLESRWTMSYLRGPLTRDHIRTLMDGKRPPITPGAPTTSSTAPEPATTPAADAAVAPIPAPPPVVDMPEAVAATTTRVATREEVVAVRAHADAELRRREARDAAVEKLREKYAPKIGRLEERISKAQQIVERESDQARNAHLQTAISIGATVLGGLLGNKRASYTSIGRATTAARGVSRSMQQRGDVERAKQDLAAAEEALEKLNAELEEEIARLG